MHATNTQCLVKDIPPASGGIILAVCKFLQSCSNVGRRQRELQRRLFYIVTHMNGINIVQHQSHEPSIHNKMWNLESNDNESHTCTCYSWDKWQEGRRQVLLRVCGHVPQQSRAGVCVLFCETARIPRDTPAKSAAEGWGPPTLSRPFKQFADKTTTQTTRISIHRGPLGH